MFSMTHWGSCSTSALMNRNRRYPRRQEAAARGIVSEHLILAVLATIQFHHKPGGRAEEVDNIRSDGLLAAKAISTQMPAAQQCP
jgi:hypothetical protein